MLAGAFRRIGCPELADEIMTTMRAASYTVRETDPFVQKRTFGFLHATTAPIFGRLQAMWKTMREAVVRMFPKAPGLPKNTDGYLRSVDEIYQKDAYHSLSIEGYRVTSELIGRVHSGSWNPDHHDGDRQSRDALAVRLHSSVS